MNRYLFEKGQAELAATKFVGKSAQDLVVATLTGDKKVVKIDFQEAVVDPEDLDKEFAFGRVIETSSSVLVEIFKKIGSAKTSINEIVNSGILFSPVKIFWDGVIRKDVS